jgi:hypothetical protein
MKANSRARKTSVYLEVFLALKDGSSGSNGMQGQGF